MLTNKGYFIPKYLYRRKIELVRQKIIKRKYGYLFLRKTISKILPSQAQNHYEKRLCKKYFRRWILYWYAETVEWKLSLRADIHYNLSLQQRFLRRWNFFHIQQKSSRIKEQIAVIHHMKNCIKQHKLLYMSKWKFYIKYRREKKQKHRLARDFFKSKHKLGVLVPYFKRWKFFSKATKKNKLKLSNAARFFENKLAIRILTKLQKFAKENKAFRIIMSNAVIYYENKLLKKIIKAWLLYVDQKHQKDQNILLAKTHYCFKLKMNCFRRILRNRDRNQFIRYIVVVASEQRRERMKVHCFNTLKNYVLYRTYKKQRMCYALLHYEQNLKKKILDRWREYLRYCIDKMKSQQWLLEKAIYQLNKHVLKKSFTKWKKFKTHKIQKKLKLAIAASFQKKYIQRKAVNAWMYMVNYKKSKRKKELGAINHYNSHMKNRSISSWKSYIKEENDFRQKLLEAKSYYQRKIINEGLLVIVKAGLHVKEETLGKCRDEIYRQLFLAQKYIGIWKQNVFYRNVGNVNTANKSPDNESLEENKENVPQVSNLEWYQICFLAPRLPKNYVDLANTS